MPVPIRLMLVSCVSWMVTLACLAGLQSVRTELIIIRKVNMKDVYHRDRYNIPRSKCTDIRQGNKCAVYGGFERSPNNPCKCLCPPLLGTMALQRNRWKCTGNKDLRLREGCGFYFPYESSRSFIKMLIPNQWQFIHAASSGCKLHALNSSYLACNGSWATSPRLAQNIDVLSRGFDQVARGYAYQVRIRKNTFLSGKMIKLVLTCRPFGGKPCLLLKMRGNQNCFSRRRRAYKRKFRKNKKAAKILSPFSVSPSLSSQSPTLMKGISRLSNARGKPRLPVTNSRRRDQSRAEKIRRDEDVTTIILIFAASVLGAMILVLAINLFFCSSDQETYKAKHLFFERKNKRKSEGSVSEAPPSSNGSTHSSNFRLNRKLSLQDSCICVNNIPRSPNSSNTELIRNSTNEIESLTQNIQASSQNSQERKDIEVHVVGEGQSSLMDSDCKVLRNT